MKDPPLIIHYKNTITNPQSLQLKLLNYLWLC